MNLEKLFKIQRRLDEHIEKEHPRQPGEDRLSKKILALQVELGELCNCWRGFKFWSKDQKPRTEKQVICSACNGEAVWYTGHIEDGLPHTEACDYCHGTGYEIVGNPLLEEFVDCLHFILSIGNDIIGELTDSEIEDILFNAKEDPENIVDSFIVLNRYSCELKFREKYDYISLLTIFLSLGLTFGFTWSEIEQAYIQKNHKDGDLLVVNGIPIKGACG